jgi:diguanylate cyclase (GGDEF)-like protein
MKFKQFSKIFRFGVRQKVILVLLTVLLLALTISGWMALEKLKKDMLAEIDQRGTDISRFVSKSLAFSVIGYDYHTIQLLLDEIALSDEIVYAKVTSKKGNTMGEAGNMDDQSPANIVTFTEDIVLNDKPVGKLTMGFSTNKTVERLEAQKFSLVTREAFIILLIAIGEFIALSYIIIRPVSIITQSLDDNIDENGQITGDIPLTSSDEFGQLAEHFNQLRSQLNDANMALQSKVEVADKQLLETNKQLVKQSEELKTINQRFKQLSITDALTGLYNRRHFEDLMETEIAMSIRYGDINSLMIFDIDHFKKVNDTHGHQKGDIVLKEIASLLRKNMRKTDILCRIGGEEFVAFSKRSTKETAIDVAEELRSSVAKHQFDLGDKTINITTSIGIATIPDEMETGNKEELFKRADIALYYCKRNGRNMTKHYGDIPIEHHKQRSNLNPV